MHLVIQDGVPQDDLTLFFFQGGVPQNDVSLRSAVPRHSRVNGVEGEEEEEEEDGMEEGMEEGGGEGRGFIVRDYVDRQQILKSPLYSDLISKVTLYQKSSI
jgi:hypothetical protein